MLKSVSLKQLKRQLVILDFLPFVYNFGILISSLLDYLKIDTVIFRHLFAFSIVVSTDLYFRSKDNNYCAWHRAPIWNMLMMNGFYLLLEISNNYFHYNLLKNTEYPILYILYGIWVFVLLISAIFFFRKRLNKNCKRCL